MDILQPKDLWFDAQPHHRDTTSVLGEDTRPHAAADMLISVTLQSKQMKEVLCKCLYEWVSENHIVKCFVESIDKLI